MKNARLIKWLAPLLYVCLGILIYANTLHAPFVLDDPKRIVNNPDIRITSLDLDSLYDAAFGSKSSGNRPFGNLTFALNYYFHGYRLPGYHAVNISLHIAAAILLYFFILSIFQTPALRSAAAQANWIAFLAALIWVAHPLHTQTVTYIVQRLNNLAALFFVLAFLLYVRGRLIWIALAQQPPLSSGAVASASKTTAGWKRYVPYGCYAAAAVSWALALLSKQIAITLPFFILLFEWYFFQNLSRRWLRRSLLWLAGVILILACIGLAYVDFDPVARFSRITDYQRQEFTMVQRLLTEPRVVLHYLSLLVYPHPSRLNLDYDFALSYSLFRPATTLPAILAVFGLIALAFWIAEKERLISFCILWYFGNLVLESSFIPVAVIFEHRTYLPSMMVFVIPFLLLLRYVALKWVPAVLAAVITVIYSAWTFQRNYIWADEARLWEDTVKKSPDKARPLNNFGNALLEKGNVDEAIELFEKALRMDPNLHNVQLNLGLALKKMGHFDEALERLTIALEKVNAKERVLYALGSLMQEIGETEKAIAYYQAAIDFNPDYEKARIGLGVVLSDLGQTDLAIQNYRQALEINPSNAEAYNNLAVQLFKSGNFSEAEKLYRQAMHLFPDYHEAYNNFGILLAETGKPEEAVEYFQKALAINPDYAEAYMSLGVTAQKQDRLEEAIEYWQKAVRIDPDHADGHYNLGLAYNRIGKLDRAVYHFNQCLRLRPDDAETHNSLGAVLIQKGNIAAAVDHFQEALRLQPDHADAKSNLEKAERILARIREKIQQLEAAAGQDPDNPVLHFQLGDLYFDIGRWDAAIEQYQTVLSLDPGLAPAVNNMGLAYKQKASYGKALDAFLAMVDRWPDNPAASYNIACVYALQNEEQDALKWLQRAVDNGYANWERIQTDPDLDNIRDSSGFRHLLESGRR